MKESSRVSDYGLDKQGFRKLGEQFWNLSEPALCEMAVKNGEGVLTANGAFAVVTGEHTGRSPNDKFIVDEGSDTEDIFWGEVNRAITAERLNNHW